MNTPSPTPAAHPHEVRRFKIACWIVVALGVFVLAMVFSFGDAPREFVDRMNLFLVPICATAFSILAYSVWRFRRETKKWPQ